MGNPLRSRADYKRALLVPIGIGILIMLLLFVGAEYVRQRAALSQEQARSVAVAREAFDLAVARETDKLTAVLDVLSRDTNLQAAWRNADRQVLQTLADPAFRALRDEHRITHGYFIRLDRTVFLRLHSPAQHDDKVDRRSLQQAIASGQTRSGIELGRQGSLTLRAVSPWRDAGGQLLGFIELGIEMEQAIAQLPNLAGADLLMLVDKRLLDRDRWQAGRPERRTAADWERYAGHVMVGATRNVDPQQLAESTLRSLLDGTQERLEVDFAGRTLVLDRLPLADAGRQPVGLLLVMTDLTEKKARQQRFLLTVCLGALVVGVLLLLIANQVLEHVYSRLSKSRTQRDLFFRKAQRDGLTGLYRRDVFFRGLAKRCAGAAGESDPLAVLMIDVDWFKQVNDSYGHPVGDQVLRTVARMIRNSVRPGDIAARYGGEEFAVLLPEMGGEAASVVAERIRTSVAAYPFVCEAGSFHITLSAGVASCPEDGSTAEALVAAADRALYAAKHGGRNQTRLHAELKDDERAAP